jgi:isoleucyl-tRNA synthetase
VLIQVESQADFEVEADGRFVVWLDTELDEELTAEGLAREVVSRVNGLRKDRGLAVEERILLGLYPGDEDLAAALDRHRALIASETLAAELELAPELPASVEDPESFDLGGGRRLRVALRRAGS